MKFMLMFFDTAVQQGHSAESTQALHAARSAYAGARWARPA